MSTLRSSQISIYNYPEHLNPFYEDDQHKRIRFWKINKNEKKQAPFGERRGSFNLGSLKDLLPLRSFRLKKKSSTLGVNKTSESPPVIRREAFSENLSAYDPKNRVSLENIFANRNSRYRSTIGPAATSFTPTPRSRYTFNNGMTPGSSMNSVVSTNPFDDLETDDEASRMSRSSLTVSGGEHKRYRKKRKAPPPPERKQDDSVMQDVVLRIDEPSVYKESSDNGLDELSRLTAEFENFVKYSNNDDVINNNVSSHECHQKFNDQENRDENGNETETKIVFSTVRLRESSGVSLPGAVDENEEESIKTHEDKRNIVEMRNDLSFGDKSLQIEDEKLEISEDKLPEETHQKENVTLKVYTEDVDKEILANGKINQESISKDVNINEVASPVAKLRIETESNCDREATPDYIPVPVREKFHVLQIEETELPGTVEIAEEEKPRQQSPSIPEEKLQIHEEIVETKNEISQKLSSQGFVRVENPIEFYEPIETFIRRTSESELSEAPKPPERRRSVKDIIESINRNQKLLKINQVAPEVEEKSDRYSYRDKPAVPSKHNVNIKLQMQKEHEHSINRLLDDLNDFDKKNSNNVKPQRFPLEGDKPVDVFEKCNVKADHENNSSAVNPIAKPRRSPDKKE